MIKRGDHMERVSVWKMFGWAVAIIVHTMLVFLFLENRYANADDIKKQNDKIEINFEIQSLSVEINSIQDRLRVKETKVDTRESRYWAVMDDKGADHPRTIKAKSDLEKAQKEYDTLQNKYDELFKKKYSLEKELKLNIGNN